MANEPLATIVVTPRERYSRALRCLATVVDNTPTPHRLVDVSGGDPPYILQALERGCRERGYELIATRRFLGSNEARNIGLARVTTQYVVFIENDVIVEPGWLEALLRCAEETGADVVGPLILYGEPAEGRCHSIGGDLSYRDEDGGLTIEENHRLPFVDLRVKRVPLCRSRCDYVEFHCLLARRDLFDEIGTLDEAAVCLTVPLRPARMALNQPGLLGSRGAPWAPGSGSGTILRRARGRIRWPPRAFVSGPTA